jgi:phage tail-like protein
VPTGKRNDPGGQFTFLVHLGVGNTKDPQAAFLECNIGIEATVAKCRKRNEKENSIRKITGLNKSTDVTFKRGVIGSLTLSNWLNDIRNGNKAANRDVTIQLRSKDDCAVVQSWKLTRARIIKFVSGPIKAKGTDLAMEELTLAYERLEMEEERHIGKSVFPVSQPSTKRSSYAHRTKT